jgi:Ca2+-binding EF-hand superfamily protein
MRHFVLLGLCASLAVSAAAQQAAPAREGPITRAAFTADMNRQFGDIDADKNGSVSPAELNGARQKAAAVLGQRRAEEMFGQLDTDKNGTLTPVEFARLVSVDTTKLPPAPLLKFDTNGDGSISRAEFTAGTGADFSRTDLNKDGTISVSELQAARAELTPAQPQGR